MRLRALGTRHCKLYCVTSIILIEGQYACLKMMDWLEIVIEIEGTSIPLVGPLVAKVKKVGLLKQPTANYRVNDPLEAH